MDLVRKLLRFQARVAVRYVVLVASLLVILAAEFTLYATVQSNRIVHEDLENHVAHIARFGADLLAPSLSVRHDALLGPILRNFANRSEVTYARVFDASRLLVTASGDGASGLKDAETQEFLAAAASAGEIEIRDGQDIMHVAQPVMADGKFVGVLNFGVTLAPLRATTDSIMRRNVSIALLFLAFALPVAAFAGHAATRPIRNLTEATRRIAAGDLAAAIPVQGRDEIADLGRSIATMVRNLSESAAAIRSLTFVDKLTGLPNRDQIELRVAGAVAALAGEDDRVAVAMVDVDRFKRVNDALGTDRGDHVLREVADRLAVVVEDWRDTSMRSLGLGFETAVARLSADEFCIMIAGPLPSGELERVMRRIMRSFDADFDADGHSLELRCSAGVAVAPSDARDAKALLHNAGVALQVAKTSGRGTWRLFSPDLDEKAYRRLMLESELRQALVRDELEVFYQPQVVCTDGKGVGAEALVRWNHPKRGMVSPGEFVPVAEETGLIVEIGTLVLKKALAQTAAWAEKGLFPRISVNVSRAQFQRQEFPALVLRALADFGVAPEQLELEITESIAMDDPTNVIGQMAPLRAAGVRFAMDDFGTGYSSLSLLTRLPFDVLKIDRSFVSAMGTGREESLVLVRTVLSMAHGLGLEVVAEGVETKAELDLLRLHQCDFAQGYFFAKPMPASRFETWYITYRRRDAHALQERLEAALREMPGARSA